MPQRRSSSKESDLQEILIDAATVQLAGLKAGIEFWSLWVKQASKFAQVASDGLGRISADQKDANEILLEITEASRESLREITDLPARAAKRFIAELDRPDETGKRRTRTKRTKTRRSGGVRTKA